MKSQILYGFLFLCSILYIVDVISFEGALILALLIMGAFFMTLIDEVGDFRKDIQDQKPKIVFHRTGDTE